MTVISSAAKQASLFCVRLFLHLGKGNNKEYLISPLYQNTFLCILEGGIFECAA